MKSFTKFLAILIAGFMISINVSAQLTATASATAVIYTALTVNKTSDLNFGVIIPTGAGNVAIAANGTVSRVNNTAHPSSVESRAVFHVVGEPNKTYTISITDAPITLTFAGPPASTMTINPVVSSPAEGVGAGLLDNTGVQDVYVGGTLNIGAAQAPGTYTNANAIVININYN